jgi:hypothetical protein
MRQRVEDLNGRRFHNRDERLLAGIAKCARCASHLVGVSAHKRDRKFPYDICNERWNSKDCDLDYVRATLLEAATMQNTKTMFRDEQFMARIWAAANQHLCAKKPSPEQ